MELTIDLYSKPNCPQCRMTKVWLEREGLQYNEIDVTQDAEAENRCRAMGYKELPVVVAASQHWSGFRHSRLMELRALAHE